MKFHPFQRIKKNNRPEASVSESDNIRSLHLGSSTVQSAMNLDNPNQLVLSYSQAMMAWCLFCSEASHISHIGLGGGSMVRWIHAYFPKIKQIAIEINPQVISIARSMFELPFEDDFFTIVQADGSEYIRIFSGSTDVLLVDGFDGEQIIESLTEESFFTFCSQALSKQGIFVANWWSADPRYMVYVDRLKRVFKQRVIEIPAQTHGNMAVLAFNQSPNISLKQLKKRAELFSTQTDLDFLYIYQKIKAYFQHEGKDLIQF